MTSFAGGEQHGWHASQLHLARHVPPGPCLKASDSFWRRSHTAWGKSALCAAAVQASVPLAVVTTSAPSHRISKAHKPSSSNSSSCNSSSAGGGSSSSGGGGGGGVSGIAVRSHVGRRAKAAARDVRSTEDESRSLTARIVAVRNVSDLAHIVRTHRTSLNAIHIAAAIVKLAKCLGSDADLPQQLIAAAGAADAALKASQRRSRNTSTAGTASAQPLTDSARAALVDAQHSSAGAVASRDGCGEHAKHVVIKGKKSGSPPRKIAGPGATLGPTSSGEADAAPSSIASSSTPGSLPSDVERPLYPHHPHLQLLHDLCADFVPLSRQCVSLRQHANVLWSLGRLRCCPHPALLQQLLSNLSANDHRLVRHGAQPQELANLAYGLAHLSCRDREVWSALAATATAHAVSLAPAEVAMLAWAFAHVRFRHVPLMLQLQSAARRHLGCEALPPRELANILWGAATLSCVDTAFFEEAATVVTSFAVTGRLNGQDVANCAWAYSRSRLRHQSVLLLDTLADLLLLRPARPSSATAASHQRSRQHALPPEQQQLHAGTGAPAVHAVGHTASVAAGTSSAHAVAFHTLPLTAQRGIAAASLQPRSSISPAVSNPSQSAESAATAANDQQTYAAPRHVQHHHVPLAHTNGSRADVAVIDQPHAGGTHAGGTTGQLTSPHPAGGSQLTPSRWQRHTATSFEFMPAVAPWPSPPASTTAALTSSTATSSTAAAAGHKPLSRSSHHAARRAKPSPPSAPLPSPPLPPCLLDRLTLQEASTFLWSLASAHHPHPKLQAELGAVLSREVSRLPPRSIATALWSCATLALTEQRSSLEGQQPSTSPGQVVGGTRGGTLRECVPVAQVAAGAVGTSGREAGAQRASVQDSREREREGRGPFAENGALPPSEQVVSSSSSSGQSDSDDVWAAVGSAAGRREQAAATSGPAEGRMVTSAVRTRSGWADAQQGDGFAIDPGAVRIALHRDNGGDASCTAAAAAEGGSAAHKVATCTALSNGSQLPCGECQGGQLSAGVCCAGPPDSVPQQLPNVHLPGIATTIGARGVAAASVVSPTAGTHPDTFAAPSAPEALSNELQQDSAAWRALPKTLLHAAAPQLGRFSPHDLANMLWACGRLHLTTSRQDLLRLSRACRQALPAMSPAGIVQVLWGALTLNLASATLLDATSVAALPLLPRCSLIELAGVAHGFGRARRADPQLFSNLAAAALPQIQRALPSRPVTWPSHSLSSPHPGATERHTLFAALPPEVGARGRGAARTAHADSSGDAAAQDSGAQRGGTQPSGPGRGLAGSTGRPPSSLVPQQPPTPWVLASLMWGFAKTRAKDPPLTAAVIEAACMQVQLFSAQELACLLWALASSGQGDVRLFDAAAEWIVSSQQSERQHATPLVTPSVSPNTRSSDAAAASSLRSPAPWSPAAPAVASGGASSRPLVLCGRSASALTAAFAMTGHRGSGVYAVLMAAATPDVSHLPSFSLVQMLWALALAEAPRTDAFLSAVALALRPRLLFFRPEEVAMVAYAFARLQHPDADLFEVVAKVAVQSARQYNLRTWSRLAWSFSTLCLPSEALLHPRLMELRREARQQAARRPDSSVILEYAKQS